MADFECWFCGEGIARTDPNAILITVENLWKWQEGTAGEDDPLQAVYAHSACAKDRLQGATMALEPEIFGEEG